MDKVLRELCRVVEIVVVGDKVLNGGLNDVWDRMGKIG